MLPCYNVTGSVQIHFGLKRKWRKRKRQEREKGNGWVEGKVGKKDTNNQ